MRIGDFAPIQGLPKDNPQVKAPEQDFKSVLDRAVASKEDKQLMDAARQFEALFIYQMFERIRETSAGEGLFPKSMGEKIFQGMLDHKISENAAEANSLGLANLIYNQLKNK